MPKMINKTHRQIFQNSEPEGGDIKQEYLTDKDYIVYHVKTEGGQIIKVKVEQERGKFSQRVRRV